MKPVVLIVLDGFGYREDDKDNAIASAKMPNFKKYFKEYPHTLIKASGLAVGLPHDQMGNSEVGHMTIGAGKTIDTDLVRINKSIKEKDFHKRNTLIELFDHVKKYNSTLHVQGLLSDGGIHSHIDHLYAFLEAAKDFGLKDIAIHVFTDGRDVPPQSASTYLKKLENFIEILGIGYIATICGRHFSMDRDNNKDRIHKIKEALLLSRGHTCDIRPSSYIDKLYKEGKIDELLEPIICNEMPINKNDGIFFFNFRSDRARQLTKEITSIAKEKNWHFVSMTDYGEMFDHPVVFSFVKIETTLAKEISKVGLSQAHIAETEKFPHATYFLNGGIEIPNKNEKHILIESKKGIITHDEAPEMRASEIKDAVIKELKSGTDFIFVNFANPDMVGHTANVKAIIEGLETTDKALGEIIEEIKTLKGVAVITSDHGNAELNIDQETGEKHTAHTTNKVPFIIIGLDCKLKDHGTLQDVTPTIFEIIKIKKPDTMTGKSLIKRALSCP